MPDRKIVGELVWAKMRGFPWWPAQIIEEPTMLNQRYSVKFFGSGETAYVRIADVEEYAEFYHKHNVQLRLPQFQKALDEIKEVANSRDIKIPEADSASAAKESSSQSSVNSTPATSKRSRVPSRLFSSPDFIVTQQKRRSNNDLRPDDLSQDERALPTLAAANSRHRTESNSSTDIYISSRRRTDSTSSRKRLISNYDLSDIEPTLTGFHAKLLNDPAIALFNGAIESEHSEDDLGRLTGRTRRRTRSKLWDEYYDGFGLRDRTTSMSSTGRHRLTSLGITEFDDLANEFSANELMRMMDALPSEESDRPMTPEEPSNMPLHERNCSWCGCKCQVWNQKWKCTNNSCNRWNGLVDVKASHPLGNSWDRSMNEAHLSDAPIELLQAPVIGTAESDKYAPSSPECKPGLGIFNSSRPFTHALNVKEDRVVKHDTKVAPSDDLKSEMKTGVRLESYNPPKRSRPSPGNRPKVEKTPPVSSDGVRYCYFCPGQVRPQMCGGNKHRWRCVDKKCRKWYGWVKINDEIPRDLGKKGRWKDLVIRVQSAQNEFEDRRASDLIPTSAVPNTPDSQSKRRIKRKYTTPRDLSPVTVKQAYYEPSCIEQKPRWWMTERRRNDYSPEREFKTDILTAAASLRLMGNSMLAAASTKADEYGSVNGSMDLLLDSLLSSMAPLLSLTNYIPGVEMPEQTIQRLYESTTLNTPLF